MTTTNKRERLDEVSRELEDPEIWNQPELAQKLGKERSSLEVIVKTIDDVEGGVADAGDLLELAAEEGDEETLESIQEDLQQLDARVAKLEFRRMFSGEMDPNHAFLDVQSVRWNRGAGLGRNVIAYVFALG